VDWLIFYTFINNLLFIFISLSISSWIDTSIENLKTLYPVQGVYKARQKSNNGRLLPFETIDKSIYKKQSNCVCFITSEKRIHAWIKAAVQILFLDLGSKSNFDVTWQADLMSQLLTVVTMSGLTSSVFTLVVKYSFTRLKHCSKMLSRKSS
jgi:hypothetical protein